MAATMQVEIVGAEKSIFSGTAEFVVVRAEKGELGILPRHAPMITRLEPGAVRVENKDGSDRKSFFVSGGMIEILPDGVTVLADTVLRAEDLDEKSAQEAKDRAKQILSDPSRKMGPDYAQARTALVEASAQIRMIQRIRKEVR
ncbi:MAG: F0F1 ATP synthase subunit epsilon [Gammaproteobacteria bacterium]|nr:MAG: F0F1 ATP synthase subunit epsilon [Gammaproteobacteria bacterium]